MPHGVEAGLAQTTPGGNRPPPLPSLLISVPCSPPTAQCELTSAAETVTSEPGRTSTLSCQGM